MNILQVLQGALRFGVLRPLDAKTNTHNISDLFFLGGPQTIRGFDMKSLGKRSGNDALGGKVFMRKNYFANTPDSHSEGFTIDYAGCFRLIGHQPYTFTHHCHLVLDEGLSATTSVPTSFLTLGISMIRHLTVSVVVAYYFILYQIIFTWYIFTRFSFHSYAFS